MTELIHEQPFRTDSGLPVEGMGLQLSLRDFATEELSRGQPGLDSQILVTSKQLCDFLTSAEERQHIQTQHQGSVNRIRQGAIKRRRPQTPPDQPSSEDDTSTENRRQAKRTRQSSEFCPSSSAEES